MVGSTDNDMEHNLQRGNKEYILPVDNRCSGCSLYVPFTLEPGETKDIR